MKIAVAKESLQNEHRVAATPASVKKLIAKGFNVAIEAGAGEHSFYPDDEYSAAGATVETSDSVFQTADIVVKIQPPSPDEVDRLKEGAILVSSLNPYENKELLDRLAKRRVSAFALEMVPRITRAQSMDILSSQANLAGYKAVLIAADRYPRLFPMLMTAAGTVRPAKVLVLGAGVAGLQAIATAKRLGGVVSAFDVRAAVKEQVQSLGAQFVEIDIGGDAEAEGGYARALTPEETERQIAGLAEVVKKSDIVITTAAIPGRKAPRLILAETVSQMKPGAVIVDLAASTSGNCELTKADETVTSHGVTIIGPSNIASQVAGEASNLFALNVTNFIFNLLDKENNVQIDSGDEIVAGSLITHDGAIVHENFKA